MRPNCEICDKDLPADRAVSGPDEAMICSFECTFCRACMTDETGALAPCPNCGGQLMPRPPRAGKALARHPASTQRVLK